MKNPHRLVVFFLFVVIAVTTLSSDFPHAGWFVVAAGIVMAAVVLTIEKVRGMTP